MAFFIKRACAVAPGLAQTRRGYCPVSQGSAHITGRQASLGPACVAPAFPLAPPVERAVRSHVPHAWAIGRAQMAIPSEVCTLLRTIYNSGVDSSVDAADRRSAASSSEEAPARTSTPVPSISSLQGQKCFGVPTTASAGRKKAGPARSGGAIRPTCPPGAGCALAF